MRYEWADGNGELVQYMGFCKCGEEAGRTRWRNEKSGSDFHTCPRFEDKIQPDSRMVDSECMNVYRVLCRSRANETALPCPCFFFSFYVAEGKVRTAQFISNLNFD